MDESDANRVVIALGQAQIDGLKEIDPQTDGHFRVVVPRDDTSRALAVLNEEQLPRPRPTGVLEALGRGALVPSPAAEHAQFVAGLAGDLERTLEQIDGVLSARVHLNLPDPSAIRPFALGDALPSKSTASVLIEHRGASSPIADEAVAKLVAGGTPSLQPGDVAVVRVARIAGPLAPGDLLAHVGPIAVARGSVRALEIALAALMILIAALSATTLALYTRLLRARPSDARESS